MEEKEKSAVQLRREALLDDRKNGYDRLTMEDEAAMNSYCEDYKRFLDADRTGGRGRGRSSGPVPGICALYPGHADQAWR